MRNKYPIVLDEDEINADSFWDKVDIQGDDDCWPWMASKIPFGYGQFGIKHKPRRAHRVAYTLFYGPIPDGLCVLHKCDNRLCVNPTHLFLGTYKDNTHDMMAKGRRVQTDAHGENNANAKVNWDDVRAIRKEYKERLGTKKATALKLELARRYGISIYQISNIVNNKSWIE